MCQELVHERGRLPLAALDHELTVRRQPGHRLADDTPMQCHAVGAAVEGVQRFVQARFGGQQLDRIAGYVRRTRDDQIDVAA